MSGRAPADGSHAEPAATAESIYVRFAAGDPSASRLDLLCEAHPQHAEALRALHEDFQCARRLLHDEALGTEPSADHLASVISGIDGARTVDTYEMATPIALANDTRVEQVWDVRLRRQVARKTLRIDVRRDELAPSESARLQRFLGELRALARLQHPGIPSLHDAGIDGQGHPFLAMSLVRGETFAAVIDRVLAGDDPLWTRAGALQVLVQACEAIGYAHARGVAHRDLAPECLIVGRFGEVIVLGWGRAAGLVPEGGLILETDRLADLHALGAMLARLLSASRSKDGLGGVPPELAAILVRAAARDSRACYGSVRELAHDLRAFLEHRVVQACAKGASGRLRAWARRNRVLAVALAVALLSLAGAVAGVILVQAREQAALRQVRDGLVAEQALAAQRLHSVEARAYANDLATAQAILAECRNVGQVRALLDRCGSGLRGYEWRLLDALADQSVRTFVGSSANTQGTLSQSLSVDGRLLAGGDGDGHVRVWDTITGETVMDVRTPGPVSCVAIRSDGRLVAAGHEDWVVRLYDVATGKRLAECPGTTWQNQVAFTPDGHVVAARVDGTVRVYSTPALTEVCAVPTRVSGGPRMATDARGTLVAISDYRGELDLLDLATGVCILRMQTPGDLGYGHPQFAVDGTELRAIGQYGILRRDLARGTSAVSPLPVGTSGWGLHLGDGSRLALCASTSIAVFDAASLQRLGTWHGHATRLNAMVADPSGRWLYSVDVGGAVKKWDLHHPLERVLSGPREEIADVACGGDAHYLVAATRTGTLWVFDLDGDEPPRSRALGLGPLAAVRATGTGDSVEVVVVPSSGAAHRVDVTTLDASPMLTPLTAETESTALRRVTTSDGTRVLELGGTNGDEIAIREAERGEVLLALPLPAAGTCISIDGSGRVLAAGLIDGRIAAWVVPRRE